MEKYTFLYKEKNTNNRDCVKYVEIDRNIFECDHYFTKINICGSCFSQSLKKNEIDFDNITSVLTKEDFYKLDSFNKSIDDLGCGIVKGDDRYKKGLELRDSIEHIISKLESEENDILFKEVIQEETEYLKQHYNLSDNDIDEIFENYGLDYKDRSIVSMIYENAIECGREYVESCMDVPSHLEEFIDYEKVGNHLLDDESYIELEDERVVYLSY